MIYKPISFAFAILLFGTPILAQEISPIVVETPRTANPTTVITGQPFTQTYVIRFIDLTDEGEEIVIQEDSLHPDNVGMSNGLEVLGLEIVKTTVRKRYLEHRWYLTYTLRIINAKKGPYVIKPITIPWVLKKTGQDAADPSLKVNTNFKTSEVHLNYVTTIPEKETNLDIRDEINFGSYSNQAIKFRILSWFFATVPLLFVGLLIRDRMSVKKTRESDSKTSPVAEDTNLSLLKVVSRKKALRNLKHILRDFSKLDPNTAEESDFFRIETALSESLNDFLKAELSLNVGATPLEMLSHVEHKLKDGRQKNLLLELVKTAVVYQQDVERGKPVSYEAFIVKTISLRECLGRMNWYAGILDLLRRR